MEMSFNELSLTPPASSIPEARQRMARLLQTCKHGKEKLGLSRLRLPDEAAFSSEISPGYSFNDWISDGEVSRIYRDLFLGLKTYPYFEDLSEKSQAAYILSRFLLNEPAQPAHGSEAHGLADAYLRSGLAVSFDSHEVWRKCAISLTVQKDEPEEGELTASVHHTCSEACFTETWMEGYKKAHRPPLNTREDVDIWFPEAEGYRLSDKAKEDLIHWFQQNQMDKLEKIEGFLREIWADPFRGTGQVEPLSENLSGWWSRRINQEHRLVYRFENGLLLVCSCQGHYQNLDCQA
jgi:toxin YoeB